MPPPPRHSSIRTSDIASRRRVNRTRDLWIDLFRDALGSLIGGDMDKIKEFTTDEADELAISAGRIADSGLSQIEARYPSL